MITKRLCYDATIHSKYHHATRNEVTSKFSIKFCIFEICKSKGFQVVDERLSYRKPERPDTGVCTMYIQTIYKLKALSAGNLIGLIVIFLHHVTYVIHNNNFKSTLWGFKWHMRNAYHPPKKTKCVHKMMQKL